MSDAATLPVGRAETQDGTPTAYDERLLLAQRTDAEINEAVLKPMLRTGKGFWALVAVLGGIIVWGLYAWSYLIQWGWARRARTDPFTGLFSSQLSSSGSASATLER